MPIKIIIRILSSLVNRRSAVILALCGLLLLVAVGILYRQVDARARRDEARRVDTIIVLGSAVWPGGRPSPSLQARTRHAISLYQQGYSGSLILCGGLGQYPPTEAEVMRQLASAAGIPAGALVLEDNSHSTEENLANAKTLMDARGWRSALIVSDPFHLLRAEMMARDLGIVAYGSPASDSPTYTIPRLRVWYTARESLALIWYYASRVVGEPVWFYRILKGRI